MQRSVRIPNASPFPRVLAILVAAGIFIIDTLTPLGIAIAVLYTLVVLLAATFLDRRGVLIVGGVCMIFTVVSYASTHLSNFEIDATIRAVVSLLAIGITTYLTQRNMETVATLRTHAALLDLTHDAVFVRDANDIITYWNAGAEKLYGWTAREAIGQNAITMLQTRFPQQRTEIDAELAERGRWEGELGHTRKDGVEMTVDSRWTVHLDSRGRLATMVTNNDITARKLAHEQLREAEQQLRQVVDIIPGMVWSSGAEAGAVDYVNARWSDMGWTAQDLDGFSWQRIIHPDDLPKARRDWAHSVATGEPYENEVRFRLADGGYRTMLVRANPMRGKTGKILHWYGLATDIEDRCKAEAALQKTMSELSHVTRVTTMGELTASIAHEINQPLAAIVTNSDAGLRWLSREPPNLDAVRNSFEKIISNGKRASDVVSRLRALAKRSDPDHAPLCLNDIVQDVLLLVEREILEHGVELDLSLNPRKPRVLGDRVQLQQVILNLIVNAIQAMTGLPQKKLRIITREASGDDTSQRAVVEVIDTGVGIDESQAARLFVAFHSTKPDGMGMGLSICRSIVEAHRGQISATANTDVGAKFSVWLPSLESAA